MPSWASTLRASPLAAPCKGAIAGLARLTLPVTLCCHWHYPRLQVRNCRSGGFGSFPGHQADVGLTSFSLLGLLSTSPVHREGNFSSPVSPDGGSEASVSRAKTGTLRSLARLPNLHDRGLTPVHVTKWGRFWNSEQFRVPEG